MKKQYTILGFIAIIGLFAFGSVAQAQTTYYNPYNTQVPTPTNNPIFNQGYNGYYCPPNYVLTLRNNVFTCMSVAYQPKTPIPTYPQYPTNPGAYPYYPTPTPSYPQYPTIPNYNSYYTDDRNDNDSGLTIDDSNDTPDKDDITVFRDETTGWKKIFSFELTAEDDDIEITRLPVTIEFLDDNDYSDMISDIKLEVDSNDDVERASISTHNDETVVTFKPDDLTIDEGETETASVWVKFKKQSGNYQDGDRLRAFIDEDNADDIEADGDDNSVDIQGTAEGETQSVEVRN